MTLINGLVGADRIPNPHYYQVSKVYQNIAFGPYENGRIRLTNKHFFTGLDEFDYMYEWLCDGVGTGLKSAVLEGENLSITPAPESRGELILNVFATLKEDEIWAQKGFAVAKEQYVVRPFDVEEIAASDCAPVIETANGMGKVQAGTETFCFDLSSGSLTSWMSGSKEILKGALEPYFWKPANENQRKNVY